MPGFGAEAYAPAPKDSVFLYGFNAIALGFIGLAGFGAFYAIDVWQQPLFVVALAGLAATLGLLFRVRQTRRHKAAHRIEYEQAEAAP